MDKVIASTPSEGAYHSGFAGDLKRNLAPAAPLRGRIVETARRFVGTPFLHQGRTPGRGLDCLGVMVAVGRALDLFDYDVAGYPRQPTTDLPLAPHIAAAGFTPLPLAEAQAGDALLMRIIRQPQHVALLTDVGLLHAWLQAGAVVEHGLDPWWRRRIIAAYAFPGVN